MTDVPFETAPVVTEQEPKQRRRRKGPGDLYVVITDEGMAMLKPTDLASALGKLPGADVYELGRKVKTLILKPGTKNLLTGEAEDDEIKVEYEETK